MKSQTAGAGLRLEFIMSNRDRLTMLFWFYSDGKFPPKAMTGVNCEIGVTVDGSDDRQFKSVLLIGSCVCACERERPMAISGAS